MNHKVNQWCRLALQPSVFRRGLMYAVIVGAVLIAINHGDAIATGSVTPAALLKMLLTIMVPYIVSTLSSVGAMRQPSAERMLARSRDSRDGANF